MCAAANRVVVKAGFVHAVSPDNPRETACGMFTADAASAGTDGSHIITCKWCRMYLRISHPDWHDPALPAQPARIGPRERHIEL